MKNVELTNILQPFTRLVSRLFLKLEDEPMNSILKAHEFEGGVPGAVLSDLEEREDEWDTMREAAGHDIMTPGGKGRLLLAAHLLHRIEELIHRRNPFCDFSNAFRGQVIRFVSGVVDAFVENAAAGKGPSETMAAALERFRSTSAILKGSISRFKEANRLWAMEVVNTDYSPELQLELMGVDKPGAFMNPVLDIGCGHSARLVKHLRETGLDARGIDRYTDLGPHTAPVDWFEHDFGDRSYGTILSHMAFSAHFLHHHFNTIDGKPEGYARTFMKILSGLKPGGVFLYSPGLPFIEEHVPRAAYNIETRPVTGPDTGALESITEGPVSDEFFYTACITRKIL